MTCVVREALLSSNDLQPSLKRLSVSHAHSIINPLLSTPPPPQKLMLPDNDTPGVISMLNSHTMVDKFVELSENSSYTEQEIESYLVYIEEEEMETTPPNDQVLISWPIIPNSYYSSY